MPESALNLGLGNVNDTHAGAEPKTVIWQHNNSVDSAEAVPVRAFQRVETVLFQERESVFPAYSNLLITPTNYVEGSDLEALLRRKCSNIASVHHSDQLRV